MTLHPPKPLCHNRRPSLASIQSNFSSKKRGRNKNFERKYLINDVQCLSLDVKMGLKFNLELIVSSFWKASNLHRLVKRCRIFLPFILKLSNWLILVDQTWALNFSCSYNREQFVSSFSEASTFALYYSSSNNDKYSQGFTQTPEFHHILEDKFSIRSSRLVENKQ